MPRRHREFYPLLKFNVCLSVFRLEFFIEYYKHLINERKSCSYNDLLYFKGKFKRTAETFLQVSQFVSLVS